MIEPLIRVRDLCKVYNPGENEVRALDHVDLSIDKGELVCIIGHSGSGKSTLMNIISGVFPADSGNELPSLPHSTPRLHGQPSDGLNGSYSLWHPSQKIHG